MNQKIVGIFICTLLIATVFPVVGNINTIVYKEDEILSNGGYTEFVHGEFIVKFADKSSLASLSIINLNKMCKISSVEKVFNNAENTKLDNIYLLHAPQNADIRSIINEYNSYPDVLYAEPNYIGELPLVPNDQFFIQQWALNNSGQFGGIPDADIDALEAWDMKTGDPDVVIASIDTGVNYTHNDLADNIWINPNEIPGNGIDDDGNGYIDDIHGWDFCYNDSEPMDTHGHGTMCASIHGFVTNNGIGGAGVCWKSKTMVVRIYETFTTQVLIAKGIKYATDNEADIINIEYYQYSIPYTIKDAIDYAYEKGCFLVAAAGNDNTSTPAYPAAFENVIAAGATNQRDERCDEDDWGPGKGSNYGDWLDVAAPGQENLVALYQNNYIIVTTAGGTSFAAPHVAGLAALLLSRNPELTADEIKTLICENVDPYNSTEYIGTGRINAQKALTALLLQNQPPNAPLITGPAEGKAGVAIDYNFTSLDPESDEMFYFIDWGDNTNSSWIGPYQSEDGITKSHIWSEKGDYTIKAKVKDTYGAESDWGILSITMPFSYNIPFMQFWMKLFERFPNAFPILRHIMGY